MSTGTAGRRLLSSLVYTGDVQAYMKMSLEPYLFRETEVLLYQLIQNHLVKYGKIPSQVTIEAVPEFEDALVEAPEPPKFYLEEVEKRYLHTSLKATIQEASSLLTGKYAEAAMDVLMKSTALAYQKRRRRELYDFREASDVVLSAYKAQKAMGSELMMPYGWETLDNMSGGMRPGDFVSFVGRPMAGKTFKLLYTAHNAWKMGKTVLFVSMEMMALIIQQRLAAMDTHTKLTNILKAEMSTAALKSLASGLAKNKSAESPLWVVDGNMAHTPDDVKMLVSQLGPDLVLVDGAYLMDHSDKKMGKWEKQADNARSMKQDIATDMGVPVVASYQLGKKSAQDKKKGVKGADDEGGEDVYGSDEIFQLSSVMLGLFDKEGDVEAKLKRRVKIMKGRNGETGSFTINWDLGANMDFSEILPVKEQKPEELNMDYMG